MTPCLGPELPHTMRVCLAMMRNVGGVRMLPVPAFSILEIDFPLRCRTIAGSVLLLEVTHSVDDPNKKRVRRKKGWMYETK